MKQQEFIEIVGITYIKIDEQKTRLRMNFALDPNAVLVS